MRLFVLPFQATRKQTQPWRYSVRKDGEALSQGRAMIVVFADLDREQTGIIMRQTRTFFVAATAEDGPRTGSAVMKTTFPPKRALSS